MLRSRPDGALSGSINHWVIPPRREGGPVTSDTKGQPITRPAGESRARATLGDFRASGSRWYLLALSATAVDTVRSELARLLLKWLLARLAAVSWLRRARTARVTNRPLTGVS